MDVLICFHSLFFCIEQFLDLRLWAIALKLKFQPQHPMTQQQEKQQDNMMMMDGLSLILSSSLVKVHYKHA